MHEQFSQSVPPFEALLKQIHNHLNLSEFQQCIDVIGKGEGFSEDQKIELMSLHAYCLTMTKQYDQAFKLLDECLERRPFHLTSKKRRAVLLEKIGKIQESKNQFEKCLYLQPQSRSLRNKLKRLSMIHGDPAVSSDSKDSSNFEQKSSQPDNSSSTVKFGSFEVIQFTADDSDEHFAMLKEEITKLSDKKPKKSILKESMSASVFKEKKAQTPKPQIKIQDSPLGDDQKPIQGKFPKEKAFSLEKKKKKTKSVTFQTDTKIQDLQ